MDSTKIAEKLLVLLCNRKRASEIVGDMLEARNGRIGATFWCSILRVALMLGWRWLVSIVAAFAVLLANFYVFGHVFQGFRGPHDEARMLSIMCLFPCAFSWCITTVAVLRYGLSERLLRICLLSSIVLTVVMYIPEFFVPRIALLLAGALLLSAIAWRQEWRRTVLEYAGALVLGYVVFTALRFADYQLLLRHITSNRLAVAVVLPTYLFSILLQAAFLQWIRVREQPSLC